MLSKVLIGILVAVSFAGYILYNKNIELVALNQAFELRNAEQIATIEAILDCGAKGSIMAAER